MNELEVVVAVGVGSMCAACAVVVVVPCLRVVMDVVVVVVE